MGTPETEEEVAAARAREKLVLFLCLVYIVRAGRRKEGKNNGGCEALKPQDRKL